MTGDQLRAIRGDRSREEFAEYLGDCSASTINKWERGINPVPQWVAEKALRKVPLNLPVDALMLLVDFARETNKSFDQILTVAIHQYLSKNTAGASASEAQSTYSKTSRATTGAAATVLTDTPARYSTAKHAQRKAAG